MRLIKITRVDGDVFWIPAEDVYCVQEHNH